MPVELTKTFGQYKKNSSAMESDLNIKVLYDPETQTVENIIDIWSYNYRWRTVTNLTSVFEESMPEATEMMLQAIDWWAEYCDSKQPVEAE